MPTSNYSRNSSSITPYNFPTFFIATGLDSFIFDTLVLLPPLVVGTFCILQTIGSSSDALFQSTFGVRYIIAFSMFVIIICVVLSPGLPLSVYDFLKWCDHFITGPCYPHHVCPSFLVCCCVPFCMLRVDINDDCVHPSPFLCHVT